MANRSIQQKIRKMKRGYGRKKRYARFSGNTSKIVERTTQVLETIGEDKVRLKEIQVYVGLVSLSNQVPKGSGPNRERMQSYYDRVPKREEALTLADVLGLVKDPRYAHIWWETPAVNRINLYTYPDSRMDMWFNGLNWFFIDLDLTRKTITRSRDYGSRSQAMTALTSGLVRWVETIPIIDTVSPTV